MSCILLSVLAVSFAIPLDSDEALDSPIEVSQPVLTNETGDFDETPASDAIESEAAAPSEAVKADEVFDDTSLEFLDDQPDSRENVVTNDESASYDG